MSQKSTAKDVAARITIDLSGVRARISELQEQGATFDDIRAMRAELSQLIRIQSSEVLS